MKKLYWFYLEPYAHVSLKKNHLLIYNPLNGKAVELVDNPGAASLLKQLLSPKNLRVVKLSTDDLQKDGIKQLVDKVKEFFVGDLLETGWSSRKPFQVPPRIKLMKEARPYLRNEANPAGVDVKSYLKVLTFYLNTNGRVESDRDNSAYKQFPWPCNTAAGKYELPLSQIVDFIAECKQSDLLRINILGKNIFHYAKLEQLVKFLNSIPLYKAYYVHYLDLSSDFHLYFQSSAKMELNIAVDFPLDTAAFSRVMKLIKDCGIRVKYNFLLEDEEDGENAEQVVSQNGLSIFSFHPFFNGRNLGMFQDSVFVSREEILASKPSEKEIITAKWMNPLAFGKLTVLSNGDIHADVNNRKLGKLGVDSIYDILYKEMVGGKSWRRIRSKVMPCKQCIFEYLCPPISGYEYVIGQNNLCRIK